MKSIFSFLLGMLVITSTSFANVSPPSPGIEHECDVLELHISPDLAVVVSVDAPNLITAHVADSTEMSTYKLTHSDISPALSIGTSQGYLLHVWHSSVSVHPQLTAHLINKYRAPHTQLRLHPPVPPIIYGMYLKSRTAKKSSHVQG